MKDFDQSAQSQFDIGYVGLFHLSMKLNGIIEINAYDADDFLERIKTITSDDEINCLNVFLYQRQKTKKTEYFPQISCSNPSIGGYGDKSGLEEVNQVLDTARNIVLERIKSESENKDFLNSLLALLQDKQTVKIYGLESTETRNIPLPNNTKLWLVNANSDCTGHSVSPIETSVTHPRYQTKKTLDEPDTVFYSTHYSDDTADKNRRKTIYSSDIQVPEDVQPDTEGWLTVINTHEDSIYIAFKNEQDAYEYALKRADMLTATINDSRTTILRRLRDLAPKV